MTDKSAESKEFSTKAKQRRTGLVREFWDFLKHNKKWWLLPILLAILLLGTLVIIGGSGVGPFIYTLF